MALKAFFIISCLFVHTSAFGTDSYPQHLSNIFSSPSRSGTMDFGRPLFGRIRTIVEATISSERALQQTQRQCAALFLENVQASGSIVAVAQGLRGRAGEALEELETVDVNYDQVARIFEQLRQPQRAVLYYAMGVRLRSVPRVIQNADHQHSLIQSLEMIMMDADAYTGDIYRLTLVYERVPEQSRRVALRERLSILLQEELPHLHPEVSSVLFNALLQRSFTGAASMSPAVRQSRVEAYVEAFGGREDALTNQRIFNFIEQAERLLGYPDELSALERY